MRARESFDPEISQDRNNLHFTGIQNDLTQTMQATRIPTFTDMPTVGEKKTPSDHAATTLDPAPKWTNPDRSLTICKPLPALINNK